MNMQTDMESRDRFMILNIVLPIIVGGIIYYFLSPEVFFVKRINEYWGFPQRQTVVLVNNIFLRFVRNYFMDFLWAYALTFAIFITWGNNAADINKIVVVAFLFSTVMESLQLVPKINGTFDVFDITIEFFAELFAAVIIKIHKGERIYEKKK